MGFARVSADAELPWSCITLYLRALTLTQRTIAKTRKCTSTHTYLHFTRIFIYIYSVYTYMHSTGVRRWRRRLSQCRPRNKNLDHVFHNNIIIVVVSSSRNSCSYRYTLRMYNIYCKTRNVTPPPMISFEDYNTPSPKYLNNN